ncbi:MAG: hypothetical protein HOY71_42475 [Nonomuraea sp.]|nr:hypothetical protein [Nonomuraea sp.]
MTELSPRSEDPEPPDDDSLLSLRSAFIMVASLIAGVLAGCLAFFATNNGPAAALAGVGAFVGAVSFFQKNISRRR